MKKIAILLRGHVRSYKKTLEKFLYFKNCENFDIDVFIHTWDTVNYNTSELTNIEEIKQLYNPVDCVVDNQLDVKSKPLFYSNSNRDKFKYQLYSMYILGNMMANYELKNDFKYDYVINTRFDLTYFVNLNEIIEKIENEYDVVTDCKFTYYDLFCVIDRKYSNLFSNMICQKHKKIINKYGSYGINPVIDFNIKNLKHLKMRFVWIVR